MNNSSEKIALGCDHAAYQLKEQVKAHLEALGLELKDFGTFDESSVDYPDYAFFVGKAVVSGECSRGIVLCGTGIGISIAANKIPGIRAALCHDLRPKPAVSTTTPTCWPLAPACWSLSWLWKLWTFG